MLKRILMALGAVTLVAALVLPAMALDTPSERRARQKIEAPYQADEAMKANTTSTKQSNCTRRQSSRRHSTINRRRSEISTISKGDIHFSLAACHLALDQEDIALKDLDNAVKVDPDAVTYRSVRSKLLFNKKDFAGAMPDCEKALASNGNDNDLMIATAQSAEQTGNRARAAEAYRKLLAADPGNTIATEGLKRTGG